MTLRKICVVTTSRADYFSLNNLIKELENDKDIIMQLIVTGLHLLPEFGNTYEYIEGDGHQITQKVHMLLNSDDVVSNIKSVGLGCIYFADVLKDLDPDIVVVLGDRFELFSVGIAAFLQSIPIAHISGGELTEGAIDEGIRHSLTKLSSIHFPAAEEYAKRVRQLGESPNKIFMFGHMGLDNLSNLKLYEKKELENILKFPLDPTSAIITYHPGTKTDISIEKQVESLIEALGNFDFNIIFTKSNCDTGGRIINKKIEKYCQANPKKRKLFDNLGPQLYLSCLKNMDLMIGNSSSGYYEAPSFRIPVVDIGDRQKGRLKAKNIISVGYSAQEIINGINLALSDKFKKTLFEVTNPYNKYENRNISHKIKETLKLIDLEDRKKGKKFYDIEIISN